MLVSSGDSEELARLCHRVLSLSRGRVVRDVNANGRVDPDDNSEPFCMTVIGMKRIRIGRRPLAGLQPGQWRYLLDYERF